MFVNFIQIVGTYIVHVRMTKSLYMFCRDIVFIFNMFVPGLIEFIDVKIADLEGFQCSDFSDIIRHD